MFAFISLKGETGHEVRVRLDQIAAVQPAKDGLGGTLVTALSGATFLGSRDVDDVWAAMHEAAVLLDDGA